MKNVYNILASNILMCACVVLVSACGTQSSRDNFQNGSGGSNLTGGSGSPGTGNIYNLPAAQQQVVAISGNNGPMPSKTISTSTSRTLNVKVTALAAQNMTIPGYTGWTFPYGCLSVSVTVNGSTQQAVMQVAGVAQKDLSPCKGAPDHVVLAFSNVMTGYGPTNVTISNANYDNCRSYNPYEYGQYYPYGSQAVQCGMRAVWQNHIVATNVEIQTDGKWMNP